MHELPKQYSIKKNWYLFRTILWLLTSMRYFLKVKNIELSGDILNSKSIKLSILFSNFGH